MWQVLTSQHLTCSRGTRRTVQFSFLNMAARAAPRGRYYSSSSRVTADDTVPLSSSVDACGGTRPIY